MRRLRRRSMPPFAAPDARHGRRWLLRRGSALTGGVEQPRLEFGRWAARNALMRTKIHPVRQPRIAGPELRQGFVATSREASLLPDFVEPARITAIAQQDVLAADPEPAGNPNLDCVLFGERLAFGSRRAIGRALGQT